MLTECFKIFTCGFKIVLVFFFVFQNILKDKGENIAHITKEKIKMPTIH